MIMFSLAPLYYSIAYAAADLSRRHVGDANDAARGLDDAAVPEGRCRPAPEFPLQTQLEAVLRALPPRAAHLEPAGPLRAAAQRACRDLHRGARRPYAR